MISNGDLLCFSNKVACRRRFDASSPSVAFDEYSTGLLILAPTLSEMFAQMMLWPWSNTKNSYEAPSQTPWIHCREMGRQTMQVISNGGLLCSGNKGSCRRSFDALVRRRSHSAMSSWPSLSNPLQGSRFTDWPAPVPMKLTHRTAQVISNGDLLCFHNKGSRRRSFDASSQHVWLSVDIQVCLVLTTRSRPGPKSGVGCRLTTLLILLHCQVSHGVRVPALSVGAGEGNFLAYPSAEAKRRTGYRWMGSRNLLISGIDVSRDPLCELAIELFDMVKRNLCTCVPLVFFKYPRSV